MDFEARYCAQVFAQLNGPLARSGQMSGQARQRSTTDRLAPVAYARDCCAKGWIVTGCPYLIAAREPKSLASSIESAKPYRIIERMIAGKQHRVPGFCQGGMRRQLRCNSTQACHDLWV